MIKLISKMATCVVVISFYTASVYADVIDTIEKSFSVESGSEFNLQNINGSVNISTWSEENIKVIATIRADNQKSFDRVLVNMSQKGNRVSVETEYEKEGFFSKHNDNANVDYEVTLPSTVAFTYIDLVNGSLNLKQINGDIKTDLVNGSTTATGLSGNGKFNAVNGGVDVSYVQLNNKVENIIIETVNGGIKLKLPSTVNAKINAETMNGGIKNDFGLPVEKQMFSGKELNGKVGEGNTSINIESVNGGIHILRSE